MQLAACSSHQFGEMIHANTANQKLFVDRYLEEGLKLDYWWMDAGWYVNRTGWPNTGTWEVDTQRFPGGLRPICDHAHAKGVKTIVWFEPERVTADTWLSTKHPEWILGGAGGGLLNLGNPAARKWLTNHVDKLLTEQAIDLYRQDYNIDPLDFWRRDEPADRQGITEIRYVEGYLAYWDQLRRRHPDMLIDSCASGGRRNDLETLRRAVPLLRSDYIIEPVGNQGHTYGMSFWIPYYGTGTWRTRYLHAAERDGPALHGLLRHAPQGPRLRPGSPRPGPVAPVRPQLLRRLLPAHSVQPGQGGLDCLAIRPARGRPGHDPGLSPRRQPLRIDPRAALRPGARGPLHAHQPRRPGERTTDRPRADDPRLAPCHRPATRLGGDCLPAGETLTLGYRRPIPSGQPPSKDNDREAKRLLIPCMADSREMAG